MLNKIINELEAKIAEYDIEADDAVNSLDIESMGSYVDKSLALKQAISIIKQHESEFEEEIKKAWLGGSETCCADYPLPETPEDYYNQNYKNE